MKILKIDWLTWGYRFGTLAIVLVLVLTMAACSTTWLVDLETYLPVAIGIATGVVSILVSSGALGPVIPAEVQAVETAVQTGLTLLCGAPVNNQCNPTSLVGQFNAGNTGVLAEIQATMATVQTNISTWLSLLHIKSAALMATITAALSLLQSTIAAIAARITGVATAAAKSTKAGVAAILKMPKMPMSAKQVREQYNSIVITGGYPAVAIS
jgi:hypothetical protein